MSKTKNITIPIPEIEYEAIKQFAEFNGKSISALMLDAIWEQIEDWEDMKAVAEYEQEKANGTLETYPLKEVMEELWLDDE